MMDATVNAPSGRPGEGRASGGDDRPGVVLLVDGGRAAFRVFEIPAEGLLLGRGVPDGCFADDDWVSRSHVELRRVAGCWSVADRDSRNGTFVNGVAVLGGQVLEGELVLRVGRSLCWAVEDVTPYLDGDSPRAAGDAPILGAALRRVWREIELASRASDTLLITGPSGAGKELAARAYHAAAHAGDSRAAPFVAVNCATIPHGLAERLLFGARRGVYSGAQDAVGFVQAANGGTLFLDELAELEPAVQAKLLRALETREVMPLGAAHPQPVSVRVCAATLRDLRREVVAGRFREDLYYRVGRPAVRIPALSERLDELPYLSLRVLQAVDPRLEPSAELVEQCALRPWPGNVRELVGELRHAAHAALAAGVTTVDARFLSPEAGRALSDRLTPAAPAHSTAPPTAPSAEPPTVPMRRPTQWPSDETIRAALERDGGNVSAAARSLGLHRNQLRRWLERKDEG